MGRLSLLSRLKWGQWLGICLVFLGLPSLIWGNWPAGKGTLVDIIINSQEMAAPTEQAAPTTQAAPTEQAELTPGEGRRILLSGPVFLRLGDDYTLDLRLEPLVELEAQDRLAQVYDLLAEARLEYPGMLFAPGGPAYSAVNSGEMAAFTWRIRPITVTDEQAMEAQAAVLWLHLDYVPVTPAMNVIEMAQENELLGVEPTHEMMQKNAPLEDPGSDGSSDQLRRLLAAPGFTLRVHSFFGLPGVVARVIGGVFMPVGLVLVLFPRMRRFLDKTPQSDLRG